MLVTFSRYVFCNFFAQHNVNMQAYTVLQALVMVDMHVFDIHLVNR